MKSTNAKSDAMEPIPSWKPLMTASLADQVYDAILDKILTRAIGVNEQINVPEVARQLGVSRTPVLEAIRKLEIQGLVKVESRRGTYVRGVTAQDVIEMSGVREAIEIYAARCVIESPGKGSTLAEMQTYVDTMATHFVDNEFLDYRSFMESDRKFHVVMVRAAGNQRLLDIYKSLNLHLYIVRSHLFKHLKSPSGVQADHLEMLQTLGHGDFDRAIHAIRAHISSIQKLMVRNVHEAGGLL